MSLSGGQILRVVVRKWDKLGTLRRKGVERREFQISNWIISWMLVPETELRNAEEPHLWGKLLAFLALSFFTFME